MSEGYIILTSFFAALMASGIVWTILFKKKVYPWLQSTSLFKKTDGK